MPDYLEDDYREPYETWKQAGGTPAASAALLGHLQPVLEGAMRAHVGSSNPLLLSQARRLALGAVRTYDPSRSRLQTHLFNQLQGLKRIHRQQTQVLRVPERVALDRYHLGAHTQELIDQLGREPSDQELAEHTGFSMKRLRHVRSYQPAVAEGTLERATPEHEVFGGVQGPGANQRSAAVHDLVYQELSPTDQLIFEHSLGYQGKPVLANHQIAAKLRRSPGLVSQRKKAIQEMLERVEDLGPF